MRILLLVQVSMEQMANGKFLKRSFVFLIKIKKMFFLILFSA